MNNRRENLFDEDAKVERGVPRAERIRRHWQNFFSIALFLLVVASLTIATLALSVQFDVQQSQVESKCRGQVRAELQADFDDALTDLHDAAAPEEREAAATQMHDVADKLRIADESC